jgi:hypothetical protein
MSIPVKGHPRKTNGEPKIEHQMVIKHPAALARTSIRKWGQEFTINTINMRKTRERSKGDSRAVLDAFAQLNEAFGVKEKEYETAIWLGSSKSKDGKIIVVEDYDTREKALAGHQKYVDILADSPRSRIDRLRDIYTGQGLWYEVTFD